MTSRLLALRFAANDPERLARFWGGVLEREVSGQAQDGITLLPRDDLELPLRFHPSRSEKVQPNQMHFDLTSTSLSDQEQTVARALHLGARHLDIGQGPDAEHVVLADPEGNEFCVIEPGNRFLAGCGTVGALSCDGTQEVGYFWSAALGWPLVWDQDQETAVQSPLGGTKISWGGPPVRAKAAENRLQLDLAPAPPAEVDAEVERLMALGATRRDAPAGPGRVLMADPDGNEFCVTG